MLNRSDYISKLSNILQDTSTFKRVNIEDEKALNQLIHMENSHFSSSLKDQGEISERRKN